MSSLSVSAEVAAPSAPLAPPPQQGQTQGASLAMRAQGQDQDRIVAEQNLDQARDQYLRIQIRGSRDLFVQDERAPMFREAVGVARVSWGVCIKEKSDGIRSAALAARFCRNETVGKIVNASLLVTKIIDNDYCAAAVGSMQALFDAIFGGGTYSALVWRNRVLDAAEGAFGLVDSLDAVDATRFYERHGAGYDKIMIAVELERRWSMPSLALPVYNALRHALLRRMIPSTVTLPRIESEILVDRDLHAMIQNSFPQVALRLASRGDV